MFSELEDGWERRKVEVFADGHSAFADSARSSGDTELGLAPFPGVDEVNTDPTMHAAPITRAEFDLIWIEATRS
jgi:hypothetical protein